MLSAIPNFNYFAANEKGNKLELCHQKSNTVHSEVTARELSCSRNKTHVFSGKPIFFRKKLWGKTITWVKMHVGLL